jgi:GH18 family chitinase/sugar lactone lactonase YvrE
MSQIQMITRVKNLLCGVVLGYPLFAVPAAAQTSHWLTGYYATYNYSVMSTSQLDYTKLTHVIYWPVIPNSSSAGNLNTTPFGLSPTTFANGANDLVTRAHAAGAKALIGIGGDQSSGATAGFQISTNSTYQATFIRNIVALMQQYGFDGVDINWEQIQTSDNSDFTSFIANLRAALTTASPTTHLLLTMPPETKPNGGRPDLLAQVYQDLDQINIQTYQMSGPYCGWETWYNSPLNNGGATFSLESSEQLPSITNAIADYTVAGVPQGLLAMGIQVDSEVWTGGQGTSTGGVTQPKQTWTGDGHSAYCSTTNPSAPNINTLAYRLMINTLATTAGYTTNFGATADQSWLSYDPSGTGTTNESQDSFVSFDSPTSIAKKGVDMSSMPSYPGVGGTLGGVFIFELSGDFASSAPTAQQHPLLNAAHSMQILLPSLITSLNATADTSSIKVTWPAASFATSYNVSYSTTSGAIGTILNVATNQASFTNLTPGQQYYFQVQPVNAIGVGVWTLQMSATFPGQQAPTVTWNTEWFPAAYGTPLSSSYLNATASVPGTFVYKPVVNTILPVGSNAVSLTFTPSSTSYSAVTQAGVVTSATISPSPAFGSLDVGRESVAHAFTFSFPSAGTLTSLQALTLGAPGLDFQVVAGGTCIVGQAYAAGATCQAFVTFSPMVAGLRRGALVFQTGTTSLTTFISGVAYSGQLAYGPGSLKSLDGLPFENLPTSDVVDGSGNVYFSDHLSDTVWKLTPGGSHTAYATGFAEPPYNLALDGAGNLYVSVPGNYQTIKVTPSGAQTQVGSGYIQAFGLAVDGNGDLFMSNRYGGNIVEVTPTGAQTVFLSGSVLGSNLSSLSDLAIDSAGNLYLADSGNNRVLKVPVSGSPSLYLSVSGAIALAMSNTDILYVADNANNRILAIGVGGSSQNTVFTGTVRGHALDATGLAVDLQDNLYIAEENDEDVVEIIRSTPPSLTFASTILGQPAAIARRRPPFITPEMKT